MTARLLVFAILGATLPLAGCQTAPSTTFLPPAQRNQQPFECSAKACYPDVDPNRPEWVRENIRVDLDGSINLHLVDVEAAYEEPAITLKPGAAIECPAQAKRMVHCKFTKDAKRGDKYGYTIHVKGKPPYDPYVLPR